MSLLDRLTASAVPVHHTKTSGGPWDGPGNVARLGDDPTAAQMRALFAWKPDDADDAKGKSNWRFPHHEVASDGTVGPANLKACSAIIAALNGARGNRPSIPDSARAGVYAHARAHLVDGGAKPDDVPKLMSAEEVAEFIASMSHGTLSGRHAHPHASYGHQGGDVTHEHEHSHDGDASHDHHRVVTAGGMPLGPLSYVGACHEHPGDHAHDPVALVADAMARLGSPWGVAQAGPEEFRVLSAGGHVEWTAGTYAEAVGHVGEQLAARGDVPVLPERWRSDMAFEGVDTGDGRFIRPGATQFRDCPLPLMLQTETAGGHMGAVLAGTIRQAGMVGATAAGSGDFDDSDAGRQFVSIIAARDRFGVSIDVAEAEGEFVCTDTDVDGSCLDGRVEFSLVRVMGVTGSPFPAFEDAYIALDPQAQAIAADGEPCAGCEEDLERRATEEAERRSGQPAGQSVVAAGPAAPPLEWFGDPGFDVDHPERDPRLVRQPSGTYGCPLTITDEGRVFGHIALHKSCHTSYAARCVTPPRSATGYAAFMLRPLMTAEGEVVRVGHLTMGAGHATDDPRASVEEVRAHYDGAPGAVQLARVRVGEDALGIWMAGAVAPDVTEEQVAKATTLSVSGDWREVWRGRGLDLVAVAAGVTVPGFPIAASGLTSPLGDGDLVGQPRARYLEGRPVVLVAAGVVRQPTPWERLIAAQQVEIADLGARLARVELVASALRPVAAERLLKPVS